MLLRLVHLILINLSLCPITLALVAQTPNRHLVPKPNNLLVRPDIIQPRTSTATSRDASAPSCGKRLPRRWDEPSTIGGESSSSSAVGRGSRDSRGSSKGSADGDRPQWISSLGVLPKVYSAMWEGKVLHVGVTDVRAPIDDIIFDGLLTTSGRHLRDKPSRHGWSHFSQAFCGYRLDIWETPPRGWEQHTAFNEAGLLSNAAARQALWILGNALLPDFDTYEISFQLAYDTSGDMAFAKGRIGRDPIEEVDSLDRSTSKEDNDVNPLSDTSRNDRSASSVGPEEDLSYSGRSE
ncbi:MAG: hypothetical protein M1825_002033 [Sarcosagium campestre]|nr:MAG: hypothetical protein M1825_002033 [Sarcosagium campestre]